MIILFNILPLIGQIQDNLPKWTTPEEKGAISAYASSRAYATDAITVPPGFPVRTMAEWEEIQALFITWRTYPSILRQIVKEAQTECLVVIICSDSNAVKSDLTTNSISLTNVRFLQKDSNTIWMRDYGGNTIYKNQVEDLMFVDWIYNRPRPKDDVIPEAIATNFSIPHYATTQPPYDLVHTGGNFMADGLGTAFSSKLVLNENMGTGYSLSPKTSAQIDTVMHEFMGINYGRYIKMDVLPYDGIHHIDMHMKLMDEQTLLMGEYPTGIADGPQINTNLQYVLSNYNSPFGTPYKVVRIPMPPDAGGNFPDNGGDYRTYANWTFVNKKILLPIYEEKYDTTAIRILQENLPGYQIAGIYCNDIIQQSGALHCITHSMGVSEPLLITHQPLEDTYNTSNPYQVTATIQHQSGIANATLMYRVQPSSVFQAVAMTQVFTSNEWVGDIPAQSPGNVIEYFITANANSGKSQVRPITAPAGFYDFEVKTLSAMETLTEGNMYAVYPNPASSMTVVPIAFSKPTEGKLTLFNLVGQKVMTIFEGKFPSGNQKYFFNAGEVPSGVYFLCLQTEDKTVTQKVMIIRD